MKQLFSTKNTQLNRTEVIDMFGNISNFIEFHNSNISTFEFNQDFY